MNDKLDFKKLAKSFVDGMQFQKIPEIKANLLVDDHFFAIGLAEVSEHFVRFRPDIPKLLENVLHGEVVLKVLGSGALTQLRHQPWMFQIGSDAIWFFEIDHVA
jgi:hypothetical protein